MKWSSGSSPSTEERAIDRIRLGTRGSRLALAQAYSVRDQLIGQYPGLEVEIVTIRTSGDRGERDRLGAFVRDIQEELLAGKVDVALHCLKDLPTEPIHGLTFAAYLEREDPRDTFISTGVALAGLPSGAVVGTGSLRRTSQLAAGRSDLTFRPLVGNVDTRMRKVIEAEYDGIVLAVAGLKRLGILAPDGEGLLSEEFRTLKVRALSPEQMLPAPGQAVLVLEVREGEGDPVAFLDHSDTRQCSHAERAFLRTFGGGCSVPVAALAEVKKEELHLTGLVASPDGTRVLQGVDTGPLAEASEIGTRLATQLGEQGAFDIVRGVVASRVTV